MTTIERDFGCRKCHHLSYVNQQRLDSANKLRISYQSPEVITNLSYPRRYTIISENYEDFVVSIGAEYYAGTGNGSERSDTGRYITRGEWLIGDNDQSSPRISLTFILDEGRVNYSNAILCGRISLLLEALAFAEIALLTTHPRLQATPIMISFMSNDNDFQRQEPWNTLGDWLPLTFEHKKFLLLMTSILIASQAEQLDCFVRLRFYFFGEWEERSTGDRPIRENKYIREGKKRDPNQAFLGCVETLPFVVPSSPPTSFLSPEEELSYNLNLIVNKVLCGKNSYW